LRVEITLVRVEISFVPAGGNCTLRLEITLVRVKIKLVRVVITFVPVKYTLRVQITLCVQQSQSAYGIALRVYKSHLSVSLSHS
jgi:hypothetical protein